MKPGGGRTKGHAFERSEVAHAIVYERFVRGESISGIAEAMSAPADRVESMVRDCLQCVPTLRRVKSLESRVQALEEIVGE